MKDLFSHWQSELVYAGATLMEVTWIALVIVFGYAVTGAAQPPPPGLGLAILFLVIMALARRIRDLPLDERRRQSLVIYGFLATLFITFKLHFYGQSVWFDPAWIVQSLLDLFAQPGVAGAHILFILVLTYAWWRGLELAAERPTSIDVFKHFQVEGILLLIFLFLASQLVPAEMVVPYAFWFFFFSLITLAAARQVTLAPERGGDATWLPMISGITGLVLLLALIATSFFSLNVILSILQPILEFISLIFTFIFTLLAYLIVAPLFALLESLMTRLEQIEVPLFKALSDLLAEMQRLSQTEIAEVPPLLNFLLKALILGGLGLIIYTLLTWLSHRPQRSQKVTGDETRESVWSTANFWQNLRRLLAQLLARLRRRRRRPSPAIPSPATARTLAERLALTVRQIYALLLQLAAQLGLRRTVDQTPYEYLHRLCEHWPGQASILGDITNAYVQVRYGQIFPTDDEVKALQAEWEQLRHELPAATTAAQSSKSTTPINHR